MTLKVAPRRVIDEADARAFVDAARQVVDSIHYLASFWTEAPGLVRLAINV